MNKKEFKDDEIKHIEMIESIIERMGQNSFSLKGWTMTLIVAICAFSAAGTERKFALIAIAPILAFWFLDAFYLQIERKYRELYNRAINHELPVFSMEIKSIKVNKTNYFCCLISRTEILFYGVCLIAIFIVFAWLAKEGAISTEIVGG